MALHVGKVKRGVRDPNVDFSGGPGDTSSEDEPCGESDELDHNEGIPLPTEVIVMS